MRRYELEQQREREKIERQRGLLNFSSGLLNPRAPSNSGGMYQTCSYNILGEIVPYPISSFRICPLSMDFGGRTGILQ